RRVDAQVEAAMTRECRQHVIVEPDARRDLRAAGAVHVQLDVDPRLRGVAVDGGAAFARDPHLVPSSSAPTAANASRTRSFCSGMPIDIRTWSRSRGVSR